MAPTANPAEHFLPRFLESFLAHLEIERGLSRNTCDAYRIDLKRFLQGLPANLLASPASIEEREVFDFLVAERRRGRSVASVKRSLSALRTFFRFLVGMGAARTNPTRNLETPRGWLRLPSVLQADEVRRLLDGVQANPSRYPLRDAALLELIYATGLRVGEAITLTLGSLRPDLKILRCLGKGSRERIVPVTQRAIEAVQKYLQAERPRLVRRRATDLLFVSRGGRPLGREVVNAQLKKYALLAGLPGKVTPHTLRHSFATHLLRRGADLRVVQEILGHAKVTTTEIYTHLSNTDLKAAHRKYHPRG
jgi:integrase/recombinase XerD